jgi:hypothetical protein
VENEGRCVPTSNSARAERGELEDLENRALEYILYSFNEIINQLELLHFYVPVYGGFLGRTIIFYKLLSGDTSISACVAKFIHKGFEHQWG